MNSATNQPKSLLDKTRKPMPTNTQALLTPKRWVKEFSMLSTVALIWTRTLKCVQSKNGKAKIHLSLWQSNQKKMKRISKNTPEISWQLKISVLCLDNLLRLPIQTKLIPYVGLSLVVQVVRVAINLEV